MSRDVSYENGRLVITKIFDAPRQAVFDAWIDASKVELWWGCAYTTEVNSEIEPRLGGKYAHAMTLKNVGQHEHIGIITEYEPPSILAYKLIDSKLDESMTVRVEFIAQGIQTKVRLTQDNLPDPYSEFVAAGWSAGFEKLAKFLAKDPQLIHSA